MCQNIMYFLRKEIVVLRVRTHSTAPTLSIYAIVLP